MKNCGLPLLPINIWDRTYYSKITVVRVTLKICRAQYFGLPFFTPNTWDKTYYSRRPVVRAAMKICQAK